MSDERTRVAEELRRIRESVRERALLEEPPASSPAPRVRTQGALPPPAIPAAPAPLPAPDTRAVNAGWEVRLAGSGLRGALFRLAMRVLGPSLDAQVAFNSSQVRYDNELAAYLESRLQAVHRHYDEVLGTYGRHLADIDERHLILQEELVAHVHDLVQRIDLVLARAERGRVSLEAALQELRGGLARLQERLLRE